MLGGLEFARELLGSTSLALMTVAQGLTFILFFMGLTSGLVKQHHIESCAAAEREGVLFRGLGWLAVGMKFSMLETAFGWITPSFGLIFFRRGIRLIGRACIIIGVVKGFVRAVHRLALCLTSWNSGPKVERSSSFLTPSTVPSSFLAHASSASLACDSIFQAQLS
jgi:hypothetical protein